MFGIRPASGFGNPAESLVWQHRQVFVAIVLAVGMLSIVLVSLDNIQDHLENPFDQVGEDDVQINAEKFANWLDS